MILSGKFYALVGFLVVAITGSSGAVAATCGLKATDKFASDCGEGNVCALDMVPYPAGGFGAAGAVTYDGNPTEFRITSLGLRDDGSYGGEGTLYVKYSTGLTCKYPIVVGIKLLSSGDVDVSSTRPEAFPQSNEGNVCPEVQMKTFTGDHLNKRKTIWDPGHSIQH